jgi:hypothetical protein
MDKGMPDHLQTHFAEGEKPEESQIRENFDAENGSPRYLEYDASADSEIEKQVVRKLDWNLVPLVMAICEYRSIRIV